MTGMNPSSVRSRMHSVLTASTSPTRPISTSSPFGSRCGRRRARRRLASLPERPIARPPWWLMRPTMSLLILPTSTISTISTVSSSVTRMPPTKLGSLPRRFIMAPIWGPPPWTITGLMPTRRRRITSRANGSLRSARSIAAPPYLMTRVLPRNSRMYGSVSSRISARRESVTDSPRLRLRRALPSPANPSQDVPREILVAGDLGEPMVDVPGVDGQLLAPHGGRVERDLLEEFFHDRIQTPGADVLGARIHAHRDLRDRLHCLRHEPEDDLLRLQELHVLRDQSIPRFGKNADEIVARQGVELDSDREAALQLRDQVRRLGDVEGAGRDEQDVIGADDPVLGRDRGPLDDGEEVTLHAFAADVRPMTPFPARDLVELVQEDDARVLGPADGLRHDIVHVDELLRFFLGQEPPRLGHPDLAALRPTRHEVREHVLEVDAHLFHPLAGQHLDHRHRLVLHLELHQPVVQPPGPELPTELVLGRFPRSVRGDLFERAAGERFLRAARQQEVEQPLLGELLGPFLDARRHLRLHHVHRQLGQVSNHRLDVPTDVAHLGVLGGFDFQERSLRQLRQSAGHFGFPDAGGTDHDDVLRCHLVAELGRDVLPPPAVAERDGHGALGLLLTDDVEVQLGDDLGGREGQSVGHRTSTVTWSLV